jgi:hypothetical protein
MKRTIKTTVEKEVEVTFPFYATDGLHYYRIDENGCLYVKHSFELFTSIEFIKNFPDIWFDENPCSEDDFLSAYETAKTELQNKIDKLFQKPDENI